MKRCRKCGVEKPLGAFYDGVGRGGKMARCKECKNGAKQEWRKTPQAKRYRQDSHLRERFGLTLADKEALFSLQKGLCAICATPFGSLSAANVDHDHQTGEVRGLLCFRCNTALERAEHEGWLAAANTYLQAGSVLVF